MDFSGGKFAARCGVGSTPLYRPIRDGLPPASDWARAVSRALKRRRRRLFSPRKPDDWEKRPFSEKIAWRCRNPDPTVDYATWADKHLVKSLVGAMFDVPDTYFVVHDPADIDAAQLPATFVMKATHGWDMSLLVEDGIVRGGNRTTEGAGQIANSRCLQQVANAWLNSRDERQRQRQEKHYQDVRPGILFERLLTPVEYEIQLFLFDGRCRFALVLYRGFHHTMTSHRLYTETWKRLAPGSDKAASGYEQSAEDIAQPPSALLENLEHLCQSIDHVRADFLVCGGKYYFCEFSFTHNGLGGPGLIGKYDAELGRCWRR
jgi:hypothetical protein